MALPPPPAGLDLAASKDPQILGVAITTYAIALFAVMLRVICRRMMGAKLWWDDWLIFLSLAAGAVMLFTVTCWMVPQGLGRHIWVAAADAMQVWAKGLFIEEMVYTVIISTIKFSILCFYWRIFKPSKLKIPIFTLGAIVSCWAIAFIFTTIFQCLPTDAFWNRFSPTIATTTKEAYQCSVDDHSFFVGNSIPNIITDAAIITLPIYPIWQLQLPTCKKIAVSSIFLLGIFITGVSIARLTYILAMDLSSPDITWNFVEGQVWSCVECFIGIACACLPSFGPLLSLMTGGSVGGLSGKSSMRYTRTRGSRMQDLGDHTLSPSNDTGDVVHHDLVLYDKPTVKQLRDCEISDLEMGLVPPYQFPAKIEVTTDVLVRHYDNGAV